MKIECTDSESGATGVVAEGDFMGIDYDPVGKGNDIFISLGKSELDSSHSVSAPVEVWELQRDDGVASSLEIMDQNDGKTILTFS